MQIVVILSLVSVVFGSLDEYYEHFPTQELSPGFRAYEIGSCSEFTDTCMKNAHEHAELCNQREQPAVQQMCVLTDPEFIRIKKEFQEASFAWHREADKCFRNAEPPGRRDQQETTDEEAEEVYQMFKRDTGCIQQDPAVSVDSIDDSLDGFKQCWTSTGERIGKCNTCALAQCERYRICMGEGSRPPRGPDRRWYNHIKVLRRYTKQKMEAFKTMQNNCLDGYE